MDISTFRSLVLLVASAAMSAIVAWWLSWTTRRHNAQLASRSDLIEVINDTQRHWGGYLIWLVHWDAGDRQPDASQLWGPHLQPRADDELITAETIRLVDQLRDPIVAGGFGRQELDPRLLARVQKAIDDDLERQRRRVASGKPLLRLTDEERADVLDHDVRITRLERIQAERVQSGSPSADS